jgi:acetolactate synthase-1/2/3 large subunit
MKSTVAKVLVRFLEQAGVEIVAGYNGHGNWAMLDAVEHESRIRGIKTNAEDAAVHLADGYWRMRRKPPLPAVLTTVGPGNMNICAALANAFYESSAMLILAGAGPTQWFDKGCFEECYRYGPEEFTRVVKPICKKAALVTRPDTALETVVRAYKEAISCRPGPVLVQVPFDIQHTEIEIGSIPAAGPWTHIHPPGPSPLALERAAGLLKESARPLILVGSGIHNALAHEALRSFAEEFQIPVGTSFSGKGALSESHPLSLGVLDPSGSGHGFRAARACDLLIAVGVRFHDFNTLAWNMYPIPESTRLVHIDVDPIELSRNYPSEVAMVADGRLAIEGLAEAARRLRVVPDKHNPWIEALESWRREWLAQVDGLAKSDKAPLSNARVLADVSVAIAEVDPETSVLFDTGNLLLFAPAFFSARSRFVATNNGHFARMGWACAGALGASLGNPGHPALSIVGDGSFLMCGLSITTACEYGIPAVWVILNNRTIGIEREAMEVLYGRSSFCDTRIQKTGRPWSPDYVKLAESIGVAGRKISKPRDLKPALKAALAAGEPFVLDVEIDPADSGYRNALLPIPMRWDQRPLMSPEEWAKTLFPADG